MPNLLTLHAFFKEETEHQEGNGIYCIGSAVSFMFGSAAFSFLLPEVQKLFLEDNLSPVVKFIGIVLSWTAAFVRVAGPVVGLAMLITFLTLLCRHPDKLSSFTKKEIELLKALLGRFPPESLVYNMDINELLASRETTLSPQETEIVKKLRDIYVENVPSTQQQTTLTV